MEMDEEYIDNVKNLIEQKDAENVKALLIDLHPADIAELCNDLEHLPRLEPDPERRGRSEPCRKLL